MSHEKNCSSPTKTHLIVLRLRKKEIVDETEFKSMLLTKDQDKYAVILLTVAGTFCVHKNIFKSTQDT